MVIEIDGIDHIDDLGHYGFARGDVVELWLGAHVLKSEVHEEGAQDELVD